MSKTNKKTVASSSKKTTTTSKVNIAATIRDLVAMGLSNAEIFAELFASKVLTEKQKWYPAWYRAQFARLSK